MKVVRFSVQEGADGYEVWELCRDWYSAGACRYELWCQCLHSDGGPLQAIVKRCDTLAQALDVCETLEAAQGGVKEVPDGCLVVDPPSIAEGEVPY